MMKRMFATMLVATLFTTPVFADEPGEDHPLLSRFSPAQLTHYATSNYDAVRVPAGPFSAEEDPEDYHDWEGRVTWLGYRVPGEHSMLEVVRNYEAAIAESDLEVLYACEGSECGNLRQLHRWLTDNSFARGTTRQGDSPAHWISFTRTNERTRLYLLQQELDHMTAHVLLFITRDWYGDVPVKVGQVVIEGEPIQLGQVETGARDADELQEALDIQGRAVIDGIYFDFDSAELLPESSEALEQMAVLMRNAPHLNVYIVGHTDNQGSLSYNRELSERRARAVLAALTDLYGISEAQMEAYGVASLAPVASNGSEEGRGRNRRVELVLQ